MLPALLSGTLPAIGAPGTRRTFVEPVSSDKTATSAEEQMGRVRVCWSVIAALALTSQAALTQVSEYRFPQRQAYPRARIYFVNNSRYEVQDLVIERDHLAFRMRGERDTTELDLDDVAIVKVATGTRALQYAGYGALISGLGAAITVIAYNSSASSDAELSNPGAFIAGFTALGAAVGATAGALSVTWRDLYVSDRASSREEALHPAVRIGKHQVSVAVNLPFRFPSED